MKKISRRTLLTYGGAASLSLSLPKRSSAGPRPVLNDASQLNPTPVAKHWIAQSQEASFIERLRMELKEAAAARRPLAVGAARHSMGGQSLPRNGTAISLAPAACMPNQERRVFRATAGTRWSDVIAALDPIGFSPAVMQSNHDFGVASTFSVNAHGWPVPYGPFGATTRSIRLMLADGTLLTCSREENQELFALCMGGYGLFGVIVEVEAEMVPNILLKPSFTAATSRNLAEQLLLAVKASETRMAYGRISVARTNFLQEALVVSFSEQPSQGRDLPRAETGGTMANLTRQIYRAQTGWETGKKMRWFAETVAAPAIASGTFTRNALLNEPVSNLASSSQQRTDILHEYFLPPERLFDFLEACRDVIPRSQQELLNITFRYVDADRESVLAFAPTARIAAVMSFAQELRPGAEADMMRMTEELIDRVIAIGGSFYLPYRLHARKDQLERAYPRLQEFVARKRHYDPGLLFRNLMWDAYFA